MAWLKGALLLGATFASGLAIGVSYERQRVPAHEVAGKTSHDALEHLTRVLELDSKQRAAIAGILARRQGAVDSTWHTLQPHVRETLHLTLREIVGVLRPEQAAKYRRMMEGRHPGVLR